MNDNDYEIVMNNKNDIYYFKKEHYNTHDNICYREIFKLEFFTYYVTLTWLISRKRRQLRYIQCYEYSDAMGFSYVIMDYKRNVKLTIVPYSEIEADVVLHNL